MSEPEERTDSGKVRTIVLVPLKEESTVREVRTSTLSGSVFWQEAKRKSEESTRSVTSIFL